jgi:hypothetical protein
MAPAFLRILSCSALLGVLTALTPLAGAAQVPLEWSAAGTDLRVVREGNTLLARGLAPVPYSQVSDMLNDIGKPLAPAAMRLTRLAPGRLVEYFFCVTLEGRLVVAQQIWREDPSRRWVFERGELSRAYSPLESGGPWTWLVDVPLARESEATVVVRAEGEWPLRSVSINLLRAP